MEPNYLSITDASRATGRSRPAVRRFVDKITADDDHPDRDMVRPSPEEVAELKDAGRTFAWSVREDFVVDGLGIADQSEAAAKPAGDRRGGPDAGTVAVLRETVGLLKDQIAEKDRQLSAAGERQREANVLLKEALERGREQARRIETLETRRLEGPSGDSESSERQKPRRGWRRLLGR